MKHFRSSVWNSVLTVVAFLVAVSSAAAHPGPRIWVNIEDGQVVTNAGPYPPSDPSNYHRSIVFSQPLANEGDGVWYTEFPGYQEVPGGSIPVGSMFEYDIVGPLLWYDQDDPGRCPFFVTVSEYFADAPPVPQMAITNEVFVTAYTSDGFVDGDLAFAYNGGSGDHNHLDYTLLGDGMTAGGGPDGIYALQLRLRSAGAVPSATFYLILGKNASEDSLQEAMNALPEPPRAGDMDCDGAYDEGDLQAYDDCLAGPGIPPEVQCLRGDIDNDGDVDVKDYAAFDLGRSNS